MHIQVQEFDLHYTVLMFTIITLRVLHIIEALYMEIFPEFIVQCCFKCISIAFLWEKLYYVLCTEAKSLLFFPSISSPCFSGQTLYTVALITAQLFTKQLLPCKQLGCYCSIDSTSKLATNPELQLLPLYNEDCITFH